MKTRTLVLANRLPYPLDDGWKRRTFHVLRALSAHSPVTLVTFDPVDTGSTLADFRAALPGVDVRTVPAPRFATFKALILGLITPTPFPVWRYRSGPMESLVREIHTEEQVGQVVVEVAYMFSHVRELAAAYCVIVDTHNIDSLVLERYAATMRGVRGWYTRLTASKLKAFEASTFRRACEVWVCSGTEERSLEDHAPGTRCVVVPNGVDSDYFRPAPGSRRGVPREILFFGRLDYYPNRDAVGYFVDAILPKIWERDESVCFVLAGRGEIDEAVRRRAVTERRIRILGPVPDLRPVLESASVVVVPLRSGGGTRLKILEALAMARPIVTTTLGMEGLDVTPGEHLLVADEPQDFAEQTLELLNDPTRANAMGREGRRAVVALYDWKAIETAIQNRIQSVPPPLAAADPTADRTPADRVSRAGHRRE